MRVLVPDHPSPALVRISDALIRYAPEGIECAKILHPRKDVRSGRLVPGEDKGDVVVLFCNGLRDHHQALADRCVTRGQRYIVVQIALRTTRHHSTEQWRRLWRGASFVMSYYPLDLWIKEDDGLDVDFCFYHAPLGVDASIFTLPPAGSHRDILVCTSGQQRSQEGVAECDEAAVSVDGRIFQLGPHLDRMKSQVSYASGISDEELARWYRQCQWVCGLRRHEGFELPAAEGLLCGSRPLLYSREHYLYWFREWGDFVPEGSHDQVVASLIELFKRGVRPVTTDERASAALQFDWAKIVRGFWGRIV